MKIEFLEKIVGKIQHEIHCPKCKNIFAKGSLDICSVTSQRIEFSSFCHVCGVSSQIVADLNLQEGGHSPSMPSKQRNVVFPTATSNCLNPERVQQITEKLSTFSGKNIQDLFQ